MANQALVFHAKEFNPFPKVQVYNASAFELVATVEVPDGDGLEYVFEVTNSIDCFWGENEGVDLYGNAVNGCRSTSVGDLVMIDNQAYVVAFAGFEAVNLINDEI